MSTVISVQLNYCRGIFEKNPYFLARVKPVLRVRILFFTESDFSKRLDTNLRLSILKPPKKFYCSNLSIFKKKIDKPLLVQKSAGTVQGRIPTRSSVSGSERIRNRRKFVSPQTKFLYSNLRTR